MPLVQHLSMQYNPSNSDFTVDGQSVAMIKAARIKEVLQYASLEGNFHLVWAHCGKNQHPHLSRRVEEFNAGRKI